MMNKQLFLADLANMTDAEVRSHITEEYGPGRDYKTMPLPARELEPFDVIIAYESVGDYGCDSSSWFLLRDRATGGLFEVHAGHCSCYGFEGQWKPEPTTAAYLLSEQFSFSCGGYDRNETEHKAVVKQFLKDVFSQ